MRLISRAGPYHLFSLFSTGLHTAVRYFHALSLSSDRQVCRNVGMVVDRKHARPAVYFVLGVVKEGKFGLRTFFELYGQLSLSRWGTVRAAHGTGATGLE